MPLSAHREFYLHILCISIYIKHYLPFAIISKMKSKFELNYAESTPNYFITEHYV